MELYSDGIEYNKVQLIFIRDVLLIKLEDNKENEEWFKDQLI